MKLDGFAAAFTGGVGLLTESGVTSPFASICCCSLKKLLLGLTCTAGILGADGDDDGAEVVEFSFTHAGLVLVTAGLGKAGLRSGLLSCPLSSEVCVKDGFDCDLFWRKGLFIS